MPSIADLYSTIDSYKRRASDVLSDPQNSLMQMLGYANDRARNYNESLAQASKERGYGPKTQELAQAMAEAYNPVGMTSKFKYPREEALKTAQKNATLPISEGGLGLHPNNTAEERANAMGYIDFLHGTERLDRVLEGKNLNPKRATSGPMPFGTDSPELASNYAKSKQDTSRIANDSGDVSNYFQVTPKAMGERGVIPFSVERTWHRLPLEKKQEILEKSRRVGYENPAEAEGPYTLHPEDTHAMPVSEDTWNYYLNKEANGNPLTALRQIWHDSGNLYGNEQDLSKIYKLAGFPYEISQANAPWMTAEGVLTGKARITNPLDTTNFENLKTNVIPYLKEQVKNDRTKLKSGPDMWGKESRWTPKQWVDQLEEDVNKGNNSYAWTSIPDKITNILKDGFGYNGILDTGNKAQQGLNHQVVIPFEPSQIRSKFAAFDPKQLNNPDMLAGVVPLGLGGAALSNQPSDQQSDVHSPTYLEDLHTMLGLKSKNFDISDVYSPTYLGDLHSFLSTQKQP